MWQTLLDGFSVLSEKWTVVFGIVIVTCLGCSPVFFLSRDLFKDRSNYRKTVLLPSGFFGVSVLFRLAFLTKALVPSYFDSVEHFRIIKILVTALGSSTLLETIPTLTPFYYHLGYHFIASLLTFGLHADPMDVILVLGQVILAAIPIPIYIFIRRETQSYVAAFFGMLLAGFGWYMPGFAVNWGKYPALAGLLALEIVAIMAYFIARNKSPRHQIVLICSLILGIILSTFFHSRTLVVILFFFVSWLLAEKMRSLPKTYQYSTLVILLAGILVFGVLTQAEPLLNLALDPYLDKGLWITLAVAVLSPFALTNFPRVFYVSILFILGVFAALFIPIGIPSPSLENQTLLDRPFVEMVLYLPLSILGGLGLAGLLRSLNDIKTFPQQTRLYAGFLTTLFLIGFTGFVSLRRYNFYPSDCCNFVKYDDTVAFDWLNRNAPPDARILIPSTQMNVNSSGPAAGSVGTDAGIWFPVLTGRDTVFAPFQSDFHSKSMLEQVCQMQIDYIYVGGTGQTFNAAQLQTEADWYERVLFLPNARLYQLMGCDK